MRISLPHFFLENQSLQDKTYYKMGGRARYFVQPQNILQVQESLFWCKKNSFPCSILGSGSNSVYADGEFRGVVISLEKLAKWFWETDEYLFVEGGVTNTEISEICMAANRGGASWMYRMPGQMGASIRMNARCYGGEISQIVRQVLTINTEGILKTYTGEEVFQGYKSTLLMNIPEIVVGARLYFPQVVSSDKLMQHMHECEADRHKKRHFYLPSCGSTFKNNYKVGRPSGQIFDELGLKGTKVGNAEVSKYHANFIWNTGNATTNDMLTLTSMMRSKAKEQINADLELEVQPVGSFSKKLYDDCGMQHLGPSYQENDERKWVGLLYYPNTNQLINEIANEQVSFPYKIFESPFFEFSQVPFKGCPSVGTQIIQLISLKEAKKFPEKPFIEWTTYLTETPEKIFSITVKPEDLFHDQKFVDELWNYSVSELFIADSANPRKNYLEFEMTPYGEWVAIEFKGIRKRSSRNEKLTQSIWNDTKINNLCVSFRNNKEMRYVFGMSFSYAQLEKLFMKNEDFLFVQCALSLGNFRYYLAPYWKHVEFVQEKKGKLVEEKKVTANFHQPEKFWKLRLF